MSNERRECGIENGVKNACNAPNWDVNLAQDKVPPAPKTDRTAIGDAHLGEDGSIELHLHSISAGHIMDSRVNYSRENPMYNRIKSHLGGLRTGEVKMVEPFLTDDNNADPEIIGKAKLNDDQSLTLTVSPSKVDNYKGENITYPSSDPYYRIVLKHLGKIGRHQEVPLKAWSD
jgi:hypothetical protein